MFGHLDDEAHSVWAMSLVPKKVLVAWVTLTLGRRCLRAPLFSTIIEWLSSPRAESARAFTGRRCPHSGRGEDFLTGQLNFFTETAVTPERKVEKSFPRSEINRHAHPDPDLLKVCASSWSRAPLVL